MTEEIGGVEKKDVCYAMFIDMRALHGFVLIGSLDEGPHIGAVGIPSLCMLPLIRLRVNTSVFCRSEPRLQSMGCNEARGDARGSSLKLFWYRLPEVRLPWFHV